MPDTYQLHLGVPLTAGTAPEAQAWNREDQLFDMIEELPNDAQIQVLIERLKVAQLRRFTVDLVKTQVRASKDTSLYPFMFVSELTSWLATAEESAASRRGIAAVLRDRERMRPQQE